ncbi:MAG: hypothetical protein ACI80S_001469, partial [Pseudohongiellaceae bacterium]
MVYRRENARELDRSRSPVSQQILPITAIDH